MIISVHNYISIYRPFAYLGGMQCNHAIINLGSHIYGSMRYREQYYDIQGIIYQEKDWGCSFPKKYIWVQSNCCVEKDAILFLSCATIPLKSFHFTGVIITIMIEGKEYRFASYFGARVIEAIRENDYFLLKIKQGRIELRFKIYMGPLYILDAPEEGLMLRNVQECLLGRTELEIIENKQSKEVLSFHHCGIENDQFF